MSERLAGPMLACGACSPEDLRFLGALTAIIVGVWVVFRLVKWTVRPVSQRSRKEISDG